MIKGLRTALPEGTERSTLLRVVSAKVLMILLGALDLLHANRPNDRALKTSLVAEFLLIGEVRFTAPVSASTPRQAPAPGQSGPGSSWQPPRRAPWRHQPSLEPQRGRTTCAPARSPAGHPGR